MYILFSIDLQKKQYKKHTRYVHIHIGVHVYLCIWFEQRLETVHSLMLNQL